MSRRKVCVVVASRANYGRVKSVLMALKARDDVELQILATASALLYRYGNVVEVMERDGLPPDARIHVVLEGDTPATMAKSTGIGITELATTFDLLRPDIVVTVADRYETMSTAIAASYMNIPLAHLQGGEVTGSIDESVRHAITKLAHLHFVSTPAARTRVLQMGEDDTKVFCTGCPALDTLAGTDLSLSPKLMGGGVGADVDLDQPFLLVLQHSVTSEYADQHRQISETVEAISSFAMPTIWLWPNIDAGSETISHILRHTREKCRPPWLRMHRNFSVEDYARLMKRCCCVVGNSSSALREGSFLGTPAVNIGVRQQGRERGRNVIDVGHGAAEITAAIRHQIDHGPYPPDTLYGDGHAGPRIAELLATTAVTTTQKIFIDRLVDGQPASGGIR